MKNSSLLFLFAAMLFHFSCSMDSSSELKKMEDKMMAVHDEVMPIWGKLPTLSTKFKNIIDAPGVSNINRGEIVKIVDRLDNAHDGMRDWMTEVKLLPALEGQSDQAIKTYFTSETEKITQISKDMKSSLADGEKFMTELEADIKAASGE